MNGSSREKSMLKILLATCEQTLDALRVAENPVDVELLGLLELMIARTQQELATFSTSDDGSGNS